MAVAGMDSVTVEVEFVAGTWTDVSASVRWSERIRGRFGRASEFDQVSAATLDLALRNEDGAFTPDNPLSPHWPNITEGKRLRVTGFRGASTYRFFTGWTAAWTPTFPTADSTSGAIVEVSAVDLLGQLDRHELGPEYLEAALALARTASTWADAYPFDDAATAVSLRNAGVVGGTSTTLGTATLVRAGGNRGSAAVNTSDAGLDLPGYVTFTPSGTTGPVLRVQPQAFGVQRLDAWVRFPVTTLPAPGIPTRVIDAWASQTTRVCGLALYNNAGVVELRLVDDSGGILGVVDTAVNDGVWRKITLATNGTTPTSMDVLVNDVAAVTGAASTDLRAVWRFYLAGACFPLVEGKQAACTGMDLAGLVLTPGTSSPLAQYAQPTASVASTTRFADFLAYVAGYYTGGQVEGVDDRQVWRTSTTGRTVLDCLQELAVTVGGIVWVTPGGTLKLYLPDMIGAAPPIATVDIELDADAQSAPPQWKRAIDSIPTRVTVTSPAGSTTVVNAAAEAAGGRRDASVSSCAASLTEAANVGAAVMHASPSLRLSQLAVDLVTTADNLWDALLAAGSTAPIVKSITEAQAFGSGTINVPLPVGTAVGDLVCVHILNASGISFAGSGLSNRFGFSVGCGYKLVTNADITTGSIHFSSTGSPYLGSRVWILTVIEAGSFNPATPVAQQWTGDNLSTRHTSAAGDNVFSPTPADPYSMMLWTSYVTTNSAGSPLAIWSSTGSKAVLQGTWGPVSGGSGLAGLATSAWGSTGSAPSAQDISWTWNDTNTREVLEGRTMVSGATDIVTLRPGVRIRATNLPTATFGISYTDAVVQGWSLDLGVDQCVLTFDTTPADDPVRGVVDDAEFGRAGATGMTVTGGTALATTSTGTLVLTTTGGQPALTVDATAYPLDLNVGGERVTVTSAPASSTSPQTVTVTARGVAPAVAQAHASGEAVDIWHASAAAQ